jgi:hypothetical protein
VPRLASLVKLDEAREARAPSIYSKCNVQINSKSPIKGYLYVTSDVGLVFAQEISKTCTAPNPKIKRLDGIAHGIDNLAD